MIANQIHEKINSYPYGARQMDLMKLSWPWLDDARSVSDSSGTVLNYSSEYFGDPEIRALWKELGIWDY